MARRKQAPKDLTGIRQRGGRYQIRLFGGHDPVTGNPVRLQDRVVLSAYFSGVAAAAWGLARSPSPSWVHDYVVLSQQLS
ncbi:MAG: hypothetical protein JO115_18995 [Pseudonocardiales bacterium]|nr:hypothetical protein [Pseudonocardiales bacterium]